MLAGLASQNDCQMNKISIKFVQKFSKNAPI